MWRVLSVASKGDYNYARVPDHPAATEKGYVLEHRIVVENHIGRLLLSNEVVHHRNGDKKDNRPENLEVMTLAGHSSHHNSGQRIKLPCSECGEPVHRAKSRIPSSGDIFCSLSCNGRFQARTRPPRPVAILHGTRAGYQAERRRGLPTCDACRTANTEDARKRRSSPRIGPGF